MMEIKLNTSDIVEEQDSVLGRIDQYELLRELGSGGFGCVYLARDTIAKIDVAVKGLPPLVRHNQNELENIRRNFALVSRLHHPNIAAALTLHPVREVVYHNKSDSEKLRVFNGDTLVVMQYASGVTLTKWAKQFPGGIVPVEKAIEIVADIASALDYAHKEKILHRDIKPENIMIDTDDKNSRTIVRVLDFGLAAEIHSSMSRVSNDSSDTSGTRPYMAPEQWLGNNQGHQTDQYSLAVVFYELITGKVPFASAFETGDSLVMFGVVSRKEVDVPTYFPKSIRQALAKALSKKQTDRFASCTEFVDGLRKGTKSSCFRLLTIMFGVFCTFVIAAAVIYRFTNGRIKIAPNESDKNVEIIAKVETEQKVEDIVNAKSDQKVEHIKNSNRKETLKGVVSKPKTPLDDASNNLIKNPPVVDDKQLEQSPPKEQKKLPPELRIMAVYNGKEMSGAKIKTMNGLMELPYKWEGNLSGRRQLGPYEVTYEKEGEYLTGEFKVESIDWMGLKTIKVELKRSDRKPIGGIGVFAF